MFDIAFLCHSGFDGAKFEFDGKVGHVYNYISSPTVELNGLIDLGLDASGNNMMNTVTRKIGLLWHDDQSNKIHLLSYSVDRFGLT